MTETALLLLAAKMVAAALVVVAASVAAEKFGPFMGAMIATLPISSGPLFIFLAIDHGGAFVSRAALTGVVSVAAATAFATAYAHLAQRLATLPAVAGALAIWLVVLLLVRMRDWSLPEALVLLYLSAFVASRLTRRFRTTARLPDLPKPAYDLPLRGALVAGVVAAVTIAAEIGGPEIAGVLAVSPVVFVSLALVMQPRFGGRAAANLLTTAFPGLAGFGTAVAALHVAAASMPIGWALAAGLAVAIFWNLTLVLWKIDRGRRPAGS